MKFRVIQRQTCLRQTCLKYFRSRGVAMEYAKEAALISGLTVTVEKWDDALSEWTTVKTIS